jgi:hypothetical protein
MVSHHPDWSDVENGYRRHRTGVFVVPGDDSALDDAPLSEATAYAVVVRTCLSEPEETRDEIARFADLRVAWEFANLLTHFFHARPVPTFARHDLLAESGALSPPTVVTERSAVDTFLSLLSPSPVPDSMTSLVVSPTV